MALNNFDYQVSWSDFVQVPAKPPGVLEDAEIVLQFPQSYDYANGRNGIIVTNLKVDIGMASPECWVLSSQINNTDLLKHEQGHYDITALGAREFYNGLSGLSGATEDKLAIKIRTWRSSIQQKIDKANSNYDTQTNHSLNTGVQQTWDTKIDGAKKNPKGTVTDLP